MRSVLIRCTVKSEGMFPTEVTVEIPTVEGAVQIYADRSLLVGEHPTTALKATRFSTERDFAICLLPVEDVDTRWVRIRAEDLQVA